MAISDRRPEPGCIHHSDRGVQYACGEYVKELMCHGFQISMSRKGNPYDNAYAESFIKTLKSEEVSLWEYRTMEDVQEKAFPILSRMRITRNGYIPFLTTDLLVSLKLW